MKLISKKYPLSYLLIILIEIVVGFVLTICGLGLDLAIYDPPEGVVGFPLPMFTVLFACLSIFVILISFVVVVIRIIYLYAKRYKE